MCKKLTCLTSVVLLLTVAGAASALDVKIDFGKGNEMTGWTKWDADNNEERTIGGVDFTISGPGTNYKSRKRSNYGDNFTYDCASFEDDATGALTLEITNLAAGDYELDAYFNALYSDRQVTVTESIDSTYGTQPFDKEIGDALVLTSTFTSTGTSHVISVDYSVTNSMPFLCGVQLVSVTSDTDPPTPNPATFASEPNAVSSSEITMTATTGSDASGPVEYFFDETSGNPGGSDSGWVTNTVYSDTGLDANTQYTYTVQMRDSLNNTGTASSSASATTDEAGAVDIKVDFGPGDVMTGYTQWNATSGNKTVDGVDFTLANSGLPAGPKLRSVTGGSSDDLTYDCISAEDPGTGTKTYTLTITNLSNGDYSLLTYFNKLYSDTSCTQQVKVDDTLKDGPDSAPLQQDKDNCLQLTANFTVTGGTSQTVTVKWEETASNGLPYICGYELSSSGGPPPDTTPPSPDPMTWATVPEAAGPYSISMTATTATDVSGVEYYFNCTAGGGNDSGWQDSTSYTDTGLTASTQYTYKVQARDKSVNQNATAFSTEESATTSSEPNTTPPVLYWALDESSGTTASDSTGNGNTGTLYNMDANDWVAGKYGNALDFDGVDDYVYDINFSTPITNDMSISCWLKFTANDPYDRALDLAGMQILISEEGRVGWDNDGGPNDVELSTAEVNDGQWHHVVFVRTGTNYQMYIDNLADATGAGTAPSYDWLYLGRREAGGYYQGQIDEVRIFNDALTAEEINALYYGGLAVLEFDSDASAGIETLDPALISVVVQNADAGGTYTVDYNVTGGTATGGGVDYTFGPNTFTFGPGQTSKDISIVIVDDGVGDSGETIILTLSDPNGPNAVLGVSEHTYTISDYQPDVAFETASSSDEEDVGTGQIAVSLSHASDVTVTVDYAVTGGDANGSGVDYTLLGSGTLTFASRVVTQYISLDVVDDNDIEDDEVVELTLSNPNNAALGSIVDHNYVIIDNEDGVLWDGLAWYYNENPDNLFVNGDGDLEWIPEKGGQYVTRIPDQDLSQVDDKVEISYFYMSDGKDDCPPNSCYNCTYCDDDITCIAGTSDFRFGLFQADGEYTANDGFAITSEVFQGYKGYNWRFGPHLQAYPTRWVDCTDEVHKTGQFCKKPQSSMSLMRRNEGEMEYIPGFELPPGEWSTITISLERTSSSNVKMSITLNDTTYTHTDTSSSEQPSMIDVFGIHMRNGRPYWQLVLGSTTAPDTDPPNPDPMTWASVPAAAGSSSIAMTATTATDISEVEYYFDCTSGGGNDSGWQDSTSYSDTGLTPDTQYCYRVQARDKSTNQNATAWSSTDCATTTSQQPQTLAQVDFGPGNVVSGWTQWNATSGNLTVNGIDFTLANSGMVAGPKLRQLTGGSSDDLTYDCISCEDPGSGTKTYTLTITNLPNGDYSLLTYFNKLYSSTGCTQQIKVDSILKAGPSSAPLQQDTANCLQLTANFTVTGGTSQVITVEWEETDGNGMPYVSGFELMEN